MKDSFKKIFQILNSDEKKSLVFISILLLLGMILEIFGLGLVFPFIVSLLDPEKLYAIDVLNSLISNLGIQKDFNFTTILLISFYLLH